MSKACVFALLLFLPLVLLYLGFVQRDLTQRKYLVLLKFEQLLAQILYLRLQLFHFVLRFEELVLRWLLLR